MAHQSTTPIGVLVTNVGTPDAPTPHALRNFLAEFLADKKVIDYPRWFWLPLLHGIILRVRPRKSAHMYQRIWTEDGSPLLKITENIASSLEQSLSSQLDIPVTVRIGMRYGQPSIEAALQSFQEQGIDQILVLPLFPQYSQTTTETTIDAVHAEIHQWGKQPELRWVHDYHDHPKYIEALAQFIRTEKTNGNKLLFSYHGVPQRYTRNGDPYLEQCIHTSELLANELGLSEDEWSYAFQSRFGPEEWLQPYTDETLVSLGESNLGGVSVLCPGFAADCLETIDEIGNEGQHTYIEAGGKAFQYIPALNDSADHIEALTHVAIHHLGDWLEN
ncbi:MAG: ferrochelatase [Chloroflexi bacterium]|nr:MAG: ferrochelatase [Chloroflexota bacterium]MBL1194493.1 ferrochelatase [Chloroflexota bacterium]NOH11781.1 ferrochelatase [Chloroflexota bacterium]